MRERETDRQRERWSERESPVQGMRTKIIMPRTEQGAIIFMSLMLLDCSGNTLPRAVPNMNTGTLLYTYGTFPKDPSSL